MRNCIARFVDHDPAWDPYSFSFRRWCLRRRFPEHHQAAAIVAELELVTELVTFRGYGC